MSQLILDEQLEFRTMLPAIQKWITAQRMPDLRPGERILDDRVPEILRTLKQPTFITIDDDFWQRHLCDPNYCILYFALRDDQQLILPDLLRELLRRPEFSTRGSRMGKVARVSTTSVEYWQFRTHDLQRLAWKGRRRRKR